MPFAAAPVPGTCSAASGRPGQLRRTHHPTLDPQVSHPQGLRHHPQQVHALREAVHRLRPDERPLPDGAGHAGELGTCTTWRCLWPDRPCNRAGRARLHALFDAGAGKSDAGVRALWDLAEQPPAPGRDPARLSLPAPCGQWKHLPSGLFVPSRNRACASAPRRRRSAWPKRTRC